MLDCRVVSICSNLGIVSKRSNHHRIKSEIVGEPSSAESNNAHLIISFEENGRLNLGNGTMRQLRITTPT
jgi:hypothetical protein